jgi:hypothetical protein
MGHPVIPAEHIRSKQLLWKKCKQKSDDTFAIVDSVKADHAVRRSVRIGSTYE